MHVISIAALKGGVGKTMTAVNLAYLFSTEYNKRVLLVDNDKQGNTSEFYGVKNYDSPSLTQVLTIKDFPITAAIKKTKYDMLDVLPSNMTLLKANKEILIDSTRVQQTRLRDALNTIKDHYDIIIIDNPPDLDMGVINALVACDSVLIPIKVDNFSFEGIKELVEQIDTVKNEPTLNPDISIAGGFITNYQKDLVNKEGDEYLKNDKRIPIFNTVIRSTTKVNQSTFASMPLKLFSKRCTAALDYSSLAAEYIEWLEKGEQHGQQVLDSEPIKRKAQ